MKLPSLLMAERIEPKILLAPFRFFERSGVFPLSHSFLSRFGWLFLFFQKKFPNVLLKNVSHRIFLVFTEFYFRVHPIEGDMTSVVLTGANTVEFLVIEFAQSLTAFRL